MSSHASGPIISVPVSPSAAAVANGIWVTDQKNKLAAEIWKKPLNT